MSRVTAVAWSPDGKRFASMIYGEKDPASERYHSEVRLTKPDGSVEATIPGNFPFGDICWTPDSQRIAIYNARQNIRLYDLHGTELSSRGYGAELVTLPKAAAWAPRDAKSRWVGSAN